MALWQIRVGPSLASSKEPRTVLDSSSDELLESIKESVRDHRSDVAALNVGLVEPNTMVQNVVLAQTGDAKVHRLDKRVVHRLRDEEAFDSDTVLSRRLADCE